MAPNIHTIHNSSNPQPRPPTFKERYCPGMHNCWYIRPAAFDPRNRSRDDAKRRYCMLIILGCSTATHLLSLFLSFINFDTIDFLIKLLLTFIGLNFLLWALPTIGDAEGERVVLGKNIDRWHLDACLVAFAGLYAVALLSWIPGLQGFFGPLAGLNPFPLWLLIWLVAWVCTWDSRPLSMA